MLIKSWCTDEGSTWNAVAIIYGKLSKVSPPRKGTKQATHWLNASPNANKMFYVSYKCFQNVDTYLQWSRHQLNVYKYI